MAIEKKSKSWGLFWSYQLNSTANPALLPQKRAKWAESAVLFSAYFAHLGGMWAGLAVFFSW